MRTITVRDISNKTSTPLAPKKLANFADTSYRSAFSPWVPNPWTGLVIVDDSEKIELLRQAYEALANFENDDGHIPSEIWRIRNETMDAIYKEYGGVIEQARRNHRHSKKD